MPCWRKSLINLVEWVFLIMFAYVFFLIIQLALFNLVILGIIWLSMTKIYQFFEAFKEKLQFNYRTKDFNAFIESQNETVYKNLGIDIQTDREGNWLEFLLRDDEQMFETQIANRRQEIFKTQDDAAIKEMKEILQNYTREKEEENRAQ
jgi:hypothetical protein